MGDAMKSLENRALDSKQDMDILAAVEQMRSMKSMHATVSVDLMLETLKRLAYEKGSEDFVRRIDNADVQSSYLSETSQKILKCLGFREFTMNLTRRRRRMSICIKVG
ncbi:hypothetical protein Cni_G24339 [Canna indica]|uniref:Uncharacterized protein n=1 Tax=Canna indica TaxID=4628 RepID=A0AAQ3KV50_9LILI|nr:hypothetical protein Cni_G24339 [Canna indica]